MVYKNRDLPDMAFELVQEGQYENALILYDKIIAKDSRNVDALMNKGVTLHSMNHLERSLQTYQMVLDISPRNVDALVNMGATLHSMKKFDDAIKCYDSALEINPNNVIALTYKGISLGEKGDIKDAIKLFKKSLAIDKSYDLPNISMNAAKSLLKKTKKANSKNNTKRKNY